MENAQHGGIEHATKKYLPKPPEKRSGIALCLSGGGFRAALFHLGALRRLNELGVLGHVDQISSVSGGSILAAHLVQAIPKWPEKGERIEDWERTVAAPFRAFTSKNLRAWPLLKRLLPWNWLRQSTSVLALADGESRLTQKMLTDLPERPEYIFCATDMVYGTYWVFEKERLGGGDFVGYKETDQAWSVARAVAASSCWPPAFDPLTLRLNSDDYTGATEHDSKRKEHVRDMSLTDGGVYDNMGLEPVWNTANVVLVSDGGGIFQYQNGWNIVQRVMRYHNIVQYQAREIRKRWLMSNFLNQTLSGTYWGLTSQVGHYGIPVKYQYSPMIVDTIISHIRTDMDAFSEGECAVLENHGYILADAAIKQHVPKLIAPNALDFTIPSEKWMDEKLVENELADSATITIPGRGWLVRSRQ